MSAIAPIRSANRRCTFLGSFGRMVLREKFLRLKFSEMQSIAFWTLKFYDASRGRRDCDGSGTSQQRQLYCLPEKLSNPVCFRRIFTACIPGALVICDQKCRLRTQIQRRFIFKNNSTKEMHPKDMTLRPIISKFIAAD